jgi:hypothetical protein
MYQSILYGRAFRKVEISPVVSYYSPGIFRILQINPGCVLISSEGDWSCLDVDTLKANNAGLLTSGRSSMDVCSIAK